MKIKYTSQEQDKEPIFNAQIQMQKAKAKKFPTAKIFFGALAIVLIIWGTIYYIRSRAIYSYGIVHGTVKQCNAPFNGIIKSVSLNKGQFVNRGDVLFSVESSDGGASMADLLERLNKKRYRLLKLESSDSISEIEDPALNELQRNLKTAQSDLIDRKASYNEQLEKKRSSVRKSKYEITVLETILEHRKERYENLNKLHKLGGATSEALKVANVEYTIAQKNLAVEQENQRLLALELASVEETSDEVVSSHENLVESYEREIKIQKDALEKSKEYAESFQDDEIKQLRAEIKSLESVVERASTGDFTYKAPFDGVVTDISISKHSLVTTGETAVTIVSTEKYWIDVYIPPEQKSIFDAAKSVNVLTPTDSVPNVEIDRTSKLFEVTVPPQLQTKMPNNNTALYTRLIPDASIALIPGTIVKVIIK